MVLALSLGCGGNPESLQGDDIVARVYDKKLLRSALSDVIPEYTERGDSVLIASAFVQRWVREQLLMYEAERNLPKDGNMDKLVQDYRASLVRFYFEQQLISEKLDSTVSRQELEQYYAAHTDQFQLETTIVKGQFIKIQEQAPLQELNKWWFQKSADNQLLLSGFVRQWGGVARLDLDKWYKIEELVGFLPQGTINAENIGSRREGTLTEGGFRYYYRVIDFVQGKRTAPLDYAMDMATRIILHQRKQELLERWKDELYTKELRRSNIKISP